MRSVRSKDTQPEMRVRSTVHALGARYRLHVKGLPGSPDMVFRSRKLCVFVHGCYWHRHPGCHLASTPSSNAVFWLEKFARNVERDARKEAELRAAGWDVAVIWECETRVQERLNALLRTMLFPSS